MHYYKHHIGDYRRCTAHLSLLEHGVYRQLLDWYYLDESPIPNETQSVYRRLAARTEVEQRAVDAVLADFFTQTPDGWINNRCSKQIGKYHDNAEKNRESGKLGGRPKKTESVIDGFISETESKPNGNPDITLTINHKPPTINQQQKQEHTPDGVTPVKKSAKARKFPIPADFGISDAVRKWAASKGHTNLERRLEHFVNSAKANGYVYSDWDAAFRNAIEGDWAKLPATAKPVDTWAGRDI
jgi:uncharacterized protein YdaU (DUF1376 family)